MIKKRDQQSTSPTAGPSLLGRPADDQQSKRNLKKGSLGHPGPKASGGKAHHTQRSHDKQALTPLPSTFSSKTSQSTTSNSLPISFGGNLPYSKPHQRSTLALQWNINGFHHNLADLELLVRDFQPVVLAIQEIHRATSRTMNNTLGKGYNWFTKTGDTIYHSVAIGLISDISANEIVLDTDLPIVAARLDWPFPVSVVSFYFPNGKLPNLEHHLNDILEQIPEPVILLGDANGHHQAWGSCSNNARGTCVANVASNNNLIILNDGSPTFSRGTAETAIDVSLASANIAHRLLWQIEPDPQGSDHSPIIIALNNIKTPETTRRPRWLFDKADWATFQETVEKRIAKSPPSSIEDLTDTIIQAAQQTIPKTSPNPGRRSLHWWDDATKKAVKKRRKTLRALKKARKKLPKDHPDLAQAKSSYQMARNECRQVVREAKERSWTEFLDSINENQSSAELWRKVNSVQGKRRVKGMALKIDGITTRDPQAIADALAEYFFDLSAIKNYPSSFLKLHPAPESAIKNFQIPPDHGQDFNLPFTLKELEFALSKVKGKSAGPDDLGYPMLKNLPYSGKTNFLTTINNEWTEQTLPEVWRQSIVVPVPKGSGPTNSVSSYRPIALTSCASKIMERMANRRLVDHLEENGFLDSRQHAFRSGYGTGTHMAHLGQILDDAKEKGEHVELVSLDLAKAYNRAWTPGVLEQLVKWGVTGNLLAFIRNFLAGRTFQVGIGNNRSKTQNEETGVPQGSVIAVTLFLVAMSGVFEVLPEGIFILVYADDILLLATGKHPKELRRKIQAATSAVARWASKAGFDISAEKSARIHICSSNHALPSKSVTVNGQKIPVKNTLKVLGVTLDRQMTFRTHFRNVKESCKSRVNMVKSISQKRTRSDRPTRLRVADAVVSSRLLYGIEITSWAQESLVETLSPIYNNTIRAVSGLLPSTPADSACAEAGVLPFRYKAALALCNRTTSFLEKTKANGQVCFLEENANLALYSLAKSKLPPVTGLHRIRPRSWMAREPKIDTSIKARFRKQANPLLVQAHFKERLTARYKNYEIRYTDGSKLAGRVGLGIHGCHPEQHYSLPNFCSVFSAEAAAIFQAVITPSINAHPLLIVTDSESTLSAMKSPTSKHPYIQAIQKALECVTPSITFMWVPGHCGIAGNERADTLAGIGRNSPKITTKVPSDDVRRWTKNIIWEAWSQDWYQQRAPFCRRVKQSTNPGVDQTDRREQVVLSRLRTGHTRISHNMGSNGSDFHRLCETCNSKNTVEHFLINCPVFNDLRRTYDITSLPQALQNDKVSERQIINFLKEAGLFNAI